MPSKCGCTTKKNTKCKISSKGRKYCAIHKGCRAYGKKCVSKTHSGEKCKNYAIKGKNVCNVHSEAPKVNFFDQWNDLQLESFCEDSIKNGQYSTINNLVRTNKRFYNVCQPLLRKYKPLYLSISPDNLEVREKRVSNEDVPWISSKPLNSEGCEVENLKELHGKYIMYFCVMPIETQEVHEFNTVKEAIKWYKHRSVEFLNNVDMDVDDPDCYDDHDDVYFSLYKIEKNKAIRVFSNKGIYHP